MILIDKIYNETIIFSQYNVKYRIMQLNLFHNNPIAFQLFFIYKLSKK